MIVEPRGMSTEHKLPSTLGPKEEKWTPKIRTCAEDPCGLSDRLVRPLLAWGQRGGDGYPSRSHLSA